MIITKNRNLYDIVINLKSRLHTALQIDAEIYIPVTITYVRTRMTEHQKMKAGDLLAAGSWVFSHIFIKYCYAIKINWKCFQVHS